MHFLLGLFTVAVLIQVVYLFLLDRAFEKYQIPSLPPEKGISIIIAARNERENLEKLIPDILYQEYKDFEIVIVDDRSTDGTAKVIWEHALNPKIKYIESDDLPLNHNSKKWALKRGIEQAKYDWLVFTDADVRIPSKNWLKEMSRGFQSEKSVVLGVSPYVVKSSWLNLFIRFETLFTAFQYVGFALIGRPYMGVGRNMGYHRNLSDGFKGYETIKGGDDDLFVNRHAKKDNTRVVLGKDSLVESYPKNSWRAFFNQKIRHLSVGKYYRSKDQWFLALFLLSQFIVWFCGCFLLISGQFPLLVLLGWSTRYIFFGMAFYRALDKMKVGFELQYLIFLDFVYPLYYLSTVIGTIWAKKTQWTKNDNSLIKLSKTSV